MANLFATTDDRFIERHEHVSASDRTILERYAHRIVAQTNLDACRRARNQRAGDAPVFLVANQLVWILQAKRETDQRRDRGQRDVALFPAQTQTENFLAVDRSAFDDAFGLRRCGIGTRLRTGQREAWNLFATRKWAKPTLLLLMGAVVQQQLTGAERIRHHHRDRSGDRATRDARDDARMRER